MRVSDSMMMQNYLYNLNQLQGALNQSQNVITTGKQLNSPSDNPLAVATDMQLTTEMAQNQAYQSSAVQAQNQLSATSTTLSDLQNTLQSVQGLVLQALNTTSSTTDAALAQNLVQLVDGLYQQVDARQGNEYLFGGYATNQQVSSYVSTNQLATNVSAASLTTPVVAKGGTLHLVGSIGHADVAVPAGTTLQSLITGINQSTAETGIAASTVNQGGTLRLVLTPAQSGQAFGVYAPSVVLTGGSTFSGTGSSVAAPPPGAGQNIEVSVSPSIQETANVTGTDLFTTAPSASAQDLQGTLQSILNDIANPSALQSDLQSLSANIHHITGAESSVGARVQQLSTLQSQLSSQNHSAQNQQATMVDANMAQAYSTYDAQLSAYQAALKVGSQILLPTLAQYV